MNQVHARSCTTLQTCAQIKVSSLPLVELAERYKIRRTKSLSDLGMVGCGTASVFHFPRAFCSKVGLWGCKSGKNCSRWGRFSLSTPQARLTRRASKWKGRRTPQDLSRSPHKLSITLTPAQEAIALELRYMAPLKLNNLPAVVQDLINPNLSRSRLDRCSRRHGLANLRTVQAQALADADEFKAPTKTAWEYKSGFLHMDIRYRRRCLTKPPGATCLLRSTAPRAG